VDEEKRSIAYLCPACRQAVIVERSVFQIAAGPVRLPCPCGKSAVQIEMRGPQSVLTVPCAVCRKDHHVSCSSHALLHEKTLAFSCGASGLHCCYVGEEEAVFAAMHRLEETMDCMENGEGSQSAFLNDAIMQEVLSEVKEIVARGGVTCECGAQALSVSIHYGSVDLVCKDCGAGIRIPAATASDVEDLCCQNSLILHKKA